MSRRNGHDQRSPSAEQEHVHDLLVGFDTVIVGTYAELDGRPTLHSRPMVLAQVDEDCTIYFVTSAESHKTDEALQDPRGHVFAQGRDRYLTLRGTYRISRDRILLKRLWSKTMDAWFDGPADPSACVLVFTPVEAELWDQSGLKGLRYLFEAAKALITGEKPPKVDDPEQHARVHIIH